MFAYHLPLQLGVGEQAVLDKVGHEHAARAQLTALRAGGGVRFFPREAYAAFRGKDQEPFPAEAVAARSQGVAIEHGAHAAETVGEHQGGGTVPCFHHGRVPVIEGALVVAHDKGPAKGFRHKHHQGMGQGSASAREQFQHVVQSGGIASILFNDRPDSVRIAEQRRGQGGFPDLHVRKIALQGIDFAVMGQHAEGLGQPGMVLVLKRS